MSLVDNNTHFLCKWRLFRWLTHIISKNNTFFLVEVKVLIHLSTYSIDNVLFNCLYSSINVFNAAPNCMLLLLIPLRITIRINSIFISFNLIT